MQVNAVLTEIERRRSNPPGCGFSSTRLLRAFLSFAGNRRVTLEYVARMDCVLAGIMQVGTLDTVC